jgi:ubiquinone biosynthesis protein
MAVTKVAQTPGHSRLGRYRQIVDILVRHGLGFMVGTHSPADLLPLPRERTESRRDAEKPDRKWQSRHLTRPQHVRMAIEELGPTFIKLGQILSTRGDLLPEAYLDELTKLQDCAPPVAEEAIRETLLHELGRPIEAAFATFEMQPLASASIGQVHAATLSDGTEVVVKLRRPGVVAQVQEDLQILLDLAAKADRHSAAAKHYDLLTIAQEFAQTLREELDYLHEAQNVERFAANFADDARVHIPRVYWQTTTAQMLTLERIRGTKISDVSALQAAGLECDEIAHHATRVLLTMILEYGFFHADPHPGNLFIEQDGRLALIDFGMTGDLDAPNRELLLRLLLAITRQDAGRLADVMLEIGRTRAHVDRNGLRRDMQRMLARYFGQPIGDLKLATMLTELLAILRWHHLRLPPNLALLVKTLGMAEGLGVRLDPAFNLMDVYVPYVEELIRRQFSFRQWAGGLMLNGIDALEMAMDLPRQLRHVLGDIERGGFEVNVQPESFEPYLDRIEELTNRLILGILAAAFTIGMAVLLSVYHPNGWDLVVGLLFLIVLSLSGSFGTYVLFLILQARHRPPRSR